MGNSLEALRSRQKFSEIDRDDVEMAQMCMQFTDAQGRAQLFCILEGSTSFKISCEVNGSCEVVTNKMRFIGRTFLEEIQNLQKQPETNRLAELRNLLKREIEEGRVLFEQKYKNKLTNISVTDVIAPEQLLKESPIELISKKQYREVKGAKAEFFKEMAETFSTAIQASIKLNQEYLEKSKPVDKSSPEGIQKTMERNIIVSTLSSISRWPIWSIFSKLKDSVVHLFDSKQELKLAQQSSYDRLKAQEYHAQRVTEKERRIENLRTDIKRSEIKREVVLDDKKRFERQKAARKQEERIFRQTTTV